MGRDTLTGSRIRERRIMLGVKQAELARKTGISASYLNLIEHNRRRIGGKLLLDLAAVLDVEPTLLTEGAEATLMASLREVAASQPSHSAELDRLEEFAGRFPGWARMIESISQQQSSLEQTVVSLTDRMTHDPQLAEALHDILGAVTSIRSTSSILVKTEELEPEWRNRFHRNINEDAQRLTEGSQSLATYLNGEMSETNQVTTPQDEIEAFFRQNKFQFPALEESSDQESAGGAITALLADAESVVISASAKTQVEALLLRYWQDAQALPAENLMIDVAAHGLEPAKIAARIGLDIGCVMRRLSSLTGEQLSPLISSDIYDIGEEGLGLAVCDSSGTLTLRKPLRGFPLPRFGAACPLWNLYQALSRPLTALRETVIQSGRDAAHFETQAFAQPITSPQFGAVALFESNMLIVPLSRHVVSRGSYAQNGDVRQIGVSCRICPIEVCAGRREPSILAGGL
ncbi:short-chain fatty acyl-CoA regulator family protein [Planktotalea sp.]|uniref:short-chain fatty acyl-CoA regulator family protein n=1 Tax=Planktotalea sp. TaxID=2029877 RepID=UPI003D6B48D9